MPKLKTMLPASPAMRKSPVFAAVTGIKAYKANSSSHSYH
jgi:hypothetical protein